MSVVGGSVLDANATLSVTIGLTLQIRPTVLLVDGSMSFFYGSMKISSGVATSSLALLFCSISFLATLFSELFLWLDFSFFIFISDLIILPISDISSLLTVDDTARLYSTSFLCCPYGQSSLMWLRGKWHAQIETWSLG